MKSMIKVNRDTTVKKEKYRVIIRDICIDGFGKESEWEGLLKLVHPEYGYIIIDQSFDGDSKPVVKVSPKLEKEFKARFKEFIPNGWIYQKDKKFIPDGPGDIKFKPIKENISQENE